MDSDRPHILVVDDDDRLRELLRKYLNENGFLIASAANAGEARTKLAGIEFDLVVLDIMMPGETGLSLAADLRKTNPVPILMLTAMGEIDDRIKGLESGADDYLPKPFEPRELVLRINSILRRAPKPAAAGAPAAVTLGAVSFDLGRRELSRDGKPVRLTTLEAALLGALAEQPGAILSREELIQRTGTEATGRAVDVQVTRLRRKIEDDPKLPRYLQTVRGKGYVLRPD
jgi:two-component system, OmpR family, phosphate regulon response regulator OmpR